MSESTEAAATAFAAARAKLAERDFAWITRAAMTEKAYWLGLFHGLAALCPGDALAREAYVHLSRCASPRAADDAFGSSPFAETLQLMREAIEDPRAPELGTLDAALGTMMAHLAEVQHDRAQAVAATHAVVAHIHPFTEPDAFRTLTVEEHARLQELVASLEVELRRLAMVELRWERQLGLTP